MNCDLDMTENGFIHFVACFNFDIYLKRLQQVLAQFKVLPDCNTIIVYYTMCSLFEIINIYQRKTFLGFNLYLRKHITHY